MAFNYDRKRGHDGQDSMWTSYSDLFLGLSVVFLLLYVTASLRQGTDGIRQQMEFQKLTQENADIKQQLKLYSTLKQDYLEHEAPKDEQESYKELMSKLDLLQDNAKQEKESLRAQAQENEKKEHALNKYQQMIRNIMTANVIAKSRIKNRDSMIADQSDEITDLDQSLAQKKAQVAAGEHKIDGLEKQLDTKLKQLKSAYKQHQMTKARYEEQQRKITQAAEAQIGNLRTQNKKAQSDIARMNSELHSTKGALEQSQTQNTKLASDLRNQEAAHEASVAKLKSDFAGQQARDKAAFDAAVSREKLSGAAKAAREAQYRADAEAKAQKMANELAGLDAKYAAMNAESEAKNKKLGSELAGLNAKYQATSAELSKAQENLNARKNVAARIKDNFQKHGIKADVDPKTGDVVLAFGDQYFENDSAKLKSGMKKILEQAVPVYSASLFDDHKIADKISNVEIVGFASPTFNGKFIDPRSLNPEDRQAVNYNLDLSYNRAKSIFSHIFDQNKMTFKYQRQLLPIVKVTGRSFLDQGERGVASESQDSFCRKNDCAKLQRVIIKFNLKD